MADRLISRQQNLINNFFNQETNQSSIGVLEFFKSNRNTSIIDKDFNLNESYIINQYRKKKLSEYPKFLIKTPELDSLSNLEEKKIFIYSTLNKNIHEQIKRIYNGILNENIIKSDIVLNGKLSVNIDDKSKVNPGSDSISEKISIPEY